MKSQQRILSPHLVGSQRSCGAADETPTNVLHALANEAPLVHFNSVGSLPPFEPMESSARFQPSEYFDFDDSDISNSDLGCEE